MYTATGGLKATFLTDFLHTAIALILIIYFTITILTHEAVGGLSGLWEKLMATAPDNYIPGNYKGSLVTMKSQPAIIWSLILKFGNLSLVVMVSSSTYHFTSITIDFILGHSILAKVLCYRSQSDRPRLQPRCACNFRNPMGTRYSYRPLSPCNP